MQYTSEQQAIAKYAEDELLVRGVAGSGKTLSILANAINKSGENASILFITFNKALNQKIEEMWGSHSNHNIIIKNFHSWAYAEVTKIYGRPNKVLWDNEKERLIRNAVTTVARSYDNRFLTTSESNITFLVDEFNFIKGKNIRSVEQYNSIERIGRGTKVQLNPNTVDREIVYKIYLEFENEKQRMDKYEFIDFGFQLYSKVDLVTSYDYVYIDEAQDLNQVELQLLRRIAKKGFYVCADDGQKIYRTNYTWTEVGANFRGGRTKRLTQSFRSTYEIFKFASEMQKNDTTLKGDNYVAPEFDESRSGIMPTVIDCKNVILRDAELVKRIMEYLKANPNDKVGVLCKDRIIGEKINTVLWRAGVPTFLQKGSEKIDFGKEVMITTLHSSKGLEFDYVIIPEFNEDTSITENEKDEEYWNNQRKLFYVAFSRARNKLDIMYFQESNKLLQEINSALYRKEEC